MNEIDEIGLRRYTAFQIGRKLIYVEDSVTRTHWVAMGHWDEYMEQRKCIPSMCLMFDKTRDVRTALLEKKVYV